MTQIPSFISGDESDYDDETVVFEGSVTGFSRSPYSPQVRRGGSQVLNFLGVEQRNGEDTIIWYQKGDVKVGVILAETLFAVELFGE